MSAGVKTWRVDYYPAGEITPIELTNVIDIRAETTGNASSNKAEVILSTVGGTGIVDGEFRYNADEVFMIYAAEGEVDTNDFTHLIGTYTILDTEVNPGNKTLRVNLMDRTYDVLSKVYVGDIVATVPDLFKNVYETVTNDRNALTDVPTTKSDGTAFDTVEYFSVAKTAFEVFNEIAQPNYTGDDRTYIFWVDAQNKLFVKYPGQTIEVQEFVYGEDPVDDMKISLSESNVVSMVIYNAGKDKNGNNYVDFYLAPNANTIKGRMRTEEMQYLSKDLQETNFWSTATNTEVQEELKRRADDNCRRIVNQIGTGLWKATIAIKGTKYEFGGLYNVSARELGFPKTALRLIKIVHTMNKDGWQTTLMFEQDAEALNI